MKPRKENREVLVLETVTYCCFSSETQSLPVYTCPTVDMSLAGAVLNIVHYVIRDNSMHCYPCGGGLVASWETDGAARLVLACRLLDSCRCLAGQMFAT